MVPLALKRLRRRVSPRQRLWLKHSFADVILSRGGLVGWWSGLSPQLMAKSSRIDDGKTPGARDHVILAEKTVNPACQLNKKPPRCGRISFVSLRRSTSTRFRHGFDYH